MSGAAGGGWRAVIGLPLGPTLALLVALLPLGGLDPPAQRTAAVAVWMAAWWMTEAVPIPATALLPLVAFPIAGIVSSSEAAAPYAHELVFLFMGGFFVARTLERHGLHRRIALAVVLAVGTGPRRLVLGVMAATAGLSMWISNTATAVMMLPIGTALVDEIACQQAAERPRDDGGDAGEGPARPAPGAPREAPRNEPAVAALGTSLMLGIAYAASIGGVATLIGTPPNLVFAGMAGSLVGGSVDFLTWMGIGLPVVAVLFPLCWLYLTRWAFPVPGSLALGKDGLRRELRSLGPLTRGEGMAAAIFAFTATCWVMRSEKVVGGLVVPGIETWLPGVTDATIAITGALLAFALPVSLGAGRFTLDWETARDIPWGVLILFGGGLSLAEGFQSTGLSGWIAGSVAGLGDVPPWIVVLAATTLVVFLTELTSNTATATLALPVFASAAVGVGLHPYVLMVGGTLAASMAFMLPVATPPNAIVFGSGMVTVPQMARAGLFLNVLSVVVSTLAALFLVPRVLGVG